MVGSLFVAGEAPCIITGAPISTFDVCLMKAADAGLVRLGCSRVLGKWNNTLGDPHPGIAQSLRANRVRT
ncbi:hypothetical protein D3C85_1491780 [compost metagenome]